VHVFLMSIEFGILLVVLCFRFSMRWRVVRIGVFFVHATERHFTSSSPNRSQEHGPSVRSKM